MATLMLEGGADVRLIQEILGHASLETRRCTRACRSEHLSAVHAATHPAERGPGVASTTAASRSGATNGREAEHMLSSLAAEVRDELAAG
jgi:integrase/recombinase XerD